MSVAVLRRLLREPLLHFFVIGAVLFGVYAMLNRGAPGAPDEIVVSRGQLQNLQLQFERVWQRPATAGELEALVDNWVKEEIFYREGVAMGLDRDDAVVRRRIGQKLEFIVESVAPAAPTEAELEAWLDANAGKYQIEAIYSLRQVYFDPGRHDNLEVDIAAAQHGLASGRAIAGDNTLLPANLEKVTATELRRTFGDEFADALKTLPAGSWQGPVPSAFGAHLVVLTRREPARPATLAEVRADVERDLARAQLQQANADFYDRLRARYSVRIESAGAPPAEPPG